MARKLAVRLPGMSHKRSKYQRAVDRSIEKLKQKWAGFAWEIIDAIGREEIKISREEFDKQIENRPR